MVDQAGAGREAGSTTPSPPPTPPPQPHPRSCEGAHGGGGGAGEAVPSPFTPRAVENWRESVCQENTSLLFRGRLQTR